VPGGRSYSLYSESTAAGFVLGHPRSYENAATIPAAAT
jgi:hypothetical protein